MQETEYRDPESGEVKTLREFFAEQVVARANGTVEQQMDERLRELSGKGHTLVRRVRIGRNDPCPCGSGKKFKRCCIDKIGAMVAYNFQKQFADAVQSGRKRQTIRANGGRRHAFPGEAVQLYTGQRTKQCRKLVDPDPPCTVSVPIAIERILMPDQVDDLIDIAWAVYVLYKQVKGQELKDLARADGFDTPEKMVEFIEQQHGLPFCGTLVGWYPWDRA